MERIINGTKKILDKQFDVGVSFCSGKPFSAYQKMYFATTENLRDYLNKYDLSNIKNALTVMASGDHAFNLVEKGILTIDTFDTNSLTEFYVLGIKCAMVLKYNYNDYLNAINRMTSPDITLEELTIMLAELFPYMDNKYRKYWKEIISYNYKTQKLNNTNLNLFNLLFINIVSADKIIERNNYLKDEITFNNFKKNLLRANICFKNINALDIGENYKNTYDIIILSNILEYLYELHISNGVKDYIKELFSIMNKDSKLFLAYIFDYKTKNYTRKNLFKFSDMTLYDFENYDMLEINSSTKKNISDGVLVLKKQ